MPWEASNVLPGKGLPRDEGMRAFYRKLVGVRNAHPDKDVWFTECSGGAWKPHWPETLPWLTRILVIGATRHWARGVLMWNLALDENHGPHLGGCKDCRGVVTIDPAMAKAWFGKVPPDLTLVARSRAAIGGHSGPDYLYTFLRTFYRDEAKATGWNNLVFPSVGMPHALWELQGERRPVYEKVMSHGHEVQVLRGWEQVKPGTMSPAEYDRAVGDLVGFMQWMAEPEQNNRVRLGVWVLIFLGVFTIIAWRLNAAFWKDVK